MDYLTIGALTFRRKASAADMRLESCSIYREKALDFADLAFDTLRSELYTKTAGAQLLAVPAGAAVTLQRGRGTKYASFVLVSISRTGPCTYAIEASSPLSRLAKMPHAGGIYTGQTVQEIVAEICADVPHTVETVYRDIKLYGWLPFVSPPQTSARDNLAQVLFAIGAHLGTDANGTLRIEKLWDGVASAPSTAYSGGSVRYTAPVSAVEVTEHQYIPGTEETGLFDGTAEEGALITFGEPMHSLNATGLAIRRSGANFAVLSAGTGTLTGRKYIHNTRIVTKSVHPAAAENVKSVTDATLISLTNSTAAAARLAAFYQRRTVLSGSIVAGQEKPGHVVQMVDPYDQRAVHVCLQSIETKLSQTTKNTLQALADFRPPQPENAELFDTRQLLTGSGTLRIPEGTRTVTAVLIGGGSGGGSGGQGGDAEKKTLTWTETGGGGAWTYYYGAAYGVGGKGGAGGLPGAGGRILQITLDVAQAASFTYACGVGGQAAAYDPEQAGTPPGPPGRTPH